MGVFTLAPDAEGRAALGLFAGLMLAAVAGTLMRKAYLRWVRAAARLAEDAGTLLAADVQRDLTAEGAGAEVQSLASGGQSTGRAAQRPCATTSPNRCAPPAATSNRSATGWPR